MPHTHLIYVAVVEFVEALGIWVEESLLKHLHNASNYSIMADECTGIATLYTPPCIRWLYDQVMAL